MMKQKKRVNGQRNGESDGRGFWCGVYYSRCSAMDRHGSRWGLMYALVWIGGM